VRLVLTVAGLLKCYDVGGGDSDVLLDPVTYQS
jgi:hypothetical protein